MAVIIVATVGAINANSFGTLAEANTYHETVYHPDVPWSILPADVDKNNRALVMAQQLMTSMIVWTGYPTTTTQKLPWPRTGMFERHELAFVPDNIIPDELKWSQFELARLLASADRTIESEIVENGITYLRAGPVTLKFKESITGPDVIPQVAWSLLVPSWYESIPGVKSQEIELLRS